MTKVEVHRRLSDVAAVKFDSQASEHLRRAKLHDSYRRIASESYPRFKLPSFSKSLHA